MSDAVPPITAAGLMPGRLAEVAAGPRRHAEGDEVGWYPLA